MQDSNVFLHALGYIAFIVLSGAAFLICFVLFVIRIAQGHAHRWNWLIAGILTLLLFLFSIFLFVNRVVTTVKNLGTFAEQKFEESMDDLQKLDSSYKYNDLNTNITIKKLIEFEAMNGETHVPKEFYVYYGFSDYYRMPLTYPFSLHCTDVLETATLYNEENVSEFNVNDNGEVETDIAGIKEFAFDNSALIARVVANGDEKEMFKVYSLTASKLGVFPSLKEALKTARKEFGYRGHDTLINVLEYNKLFK